MAKSSRGKLRVFFAEFEGDDETIQEGLKAISSAVNKTFQQKVIVKQITADSDQEDLTEEEIGEIVEMEEAEEDGIYEAKTPKTTRKRKPPQMTPVKDLDLHPAGKQSLRDFYAEKQPAKQWEKLVVFVYYLRRILEIDGITAKHVFTCFKDVDVRPPDNLPQAIYNLNNKNGYVDSSRTEGYDISTPAVNIVEHDLPRTGKK